VPLSVEDQLRLNVMLASGVDAVRIDEGRMTVYGLKDGNEAEIKLNPNCRDEKYLKQVRETLSGHVLGSPGGYPVFLKRWTRMGQMKDDSLADLLKLGEPEAVMAVVCAQGLSDELARLAWWAAPEAEHARRMLESEQVVRGSMGKELADFLVEFLPFEEDPYAIARSVRLVLQADLISEEQRRAIWDKGNRKNVFRIGFLQAIPHALPDPQPAHAEHARHAASLRELAGQGNVIAQVLELVLASPGQTFISVSEQILKKPANQEVVSALFDAVGDYFRTAWPGEWREQDINALLEQAEQACTQPHDELAAVLEAVPGLEAEIQAIMMLAQLTEAVAIPVFARSDAIGTLMRKKLEPVTTPIFKQFAVLRGRAA
jgi:hypothetical protein